MKHPPAYLEQHVRPATTDGPSRLLVDGAWCGHGEPEFAIYDVHEEGESTLRLLLPSEPYPALCGVSAGRPSSNQFFIYDPRRHPASVYAGGSKDYPYHSAEYSCSKCELQLFRLSVGFEIPGDSSSPEDTSWFAVAVECVGCGHREIAFDDETT